MQFNDERFQQRGEGRGPERADATAVGLMKGEQLVIPLVENEIGVRRTPLQLIGLGEKLNTGKERDN